MADLPAATFELIERLDATVDRFSVRWLELIAGVRPKLRLGRFGSVVAAANPANPDLDFQNRVHGLRSSNFAALDDVVEFYRDAGTRPWFEIAPQEGLADLFGALTAARAAQVGVEDVVYAVPQPIEAGDIRIRVADNEPELFARTRARAHEIPEDAARDVVAWPSVDSWRCYIAEVEGQPAAVATLTLGDRIGYLADAATVPEFRGRGCQRALIRARVVDARELGCEIVASLVTPGSQSHRNLERGGFRVAYSRSVWRGQPATV